jgi:Tol biopolymer transport system component
MRRQLSVCRTAAMLACLAGLSDPAPAGAAFPGRSGVIAFNTDDCTGGGQIATMRPDGSQRRLLTPPTCDAGQDSSSGPVASRPSWTPDGRHLLYQYFHWDPHTEVAFALTDPDGSNTIPVPLPAAPTSDPSYGPDYYVDDASFAPDGRHFTYVRQRPARTEIWVATTDGKENRRLGRGLTPRWSPDGRKIAYSVRAAGSDWQPVETKLMSARTGKPLRRLWRKGAESIDWAPDGRRLVVSSTDGELFILRADGKGARPLISTPPTSRWDRKHESAPVWSPDGRRIAFARRRMVGRPSEGREQQEIWTVSPEGARQRRIWFRYDGFDSDRNPVSGLSWQPLVD